jgi:hypothetical protein
MMNRLTLALILSLTATLLVVLSAACGGGGSDSSPTPAPSASGPPDLSPEVGGVEAARQYLLETGIDKRKGDLTDPRSCADVSGNTKDKFCVQEAFSTYAPSLVILRVAKADNPQDEVWEIRLLLRDDSWQVTSVEPFGEND